MLFADIFLFAIFLGCSINFPPLIRAQDQSGFISIDCGISDVSSYTDEKTAIGYVSDEGFTEFGENKAVSSTYKGQDDEQQLLNVRSFPQGNRNCYTLKPTKRKGTKYLIRARFKYGNYDKNNKLPTFQLYLGVDLWETVIIPNAYSVINKGIIHVPTSDHIHICLVNNGFGVPFISALELRPLQDDVYNTKKGLALNLIEHYDFSAATDKYMRYKDDIYDRLWLSLPSVNWNPFINASFNDGNFISKNDYEVPTAVASTALTRDRGDASLYWNPKVSNSSFSSTYFLYMHFTELVKLQRNDSREFNIYVNGDLWYGSLTMQYLTQITILEDNGLPANSDGKFDIWINNTANATLPPFINAAEIFVVMVLSGEETHQADVEAMSSVRSFFGLKGVTWQGDPCTPKSYRWDGLDCSYNDNSPSRIVSLNLSSSGINGEIAPSISNLSMLQYLDLSNNNLTGTVPEILTRLSSLKVLNLKGNKFLGPIPKALLDHKGLQLSVDALGNTTSCSPEPCNNNKKKHGFVVVPLVTSLAAVFIVILIIVLAILILQRRRQKNDSDSKVEIGSVETITNDGDGPLIAKNQQFTYSEIKTMTNNFERVLGKGGFGKVYHGHLNGNEVAVKMLSSPTVRGHQQFHAELKLLLQVHHKNLTILLGYCNEEANVGLIYEFMAMGNLQSHISGRSAIILSWDVRLQIAIDSAQGLEYLHNGCKPPIIHRDVKSTNILLNDKFQVKLGDFGLSKMLPLEGGNSTSMVGESASIAGTPGYLDPEYYTTNRFNEKSDVYSFGVVLLEIITARPVLSKTQEDNHIVQWVNSMLSTGNIKNIIDPRLESGCYINSAWKAIDIAMACVTRTSTERPTMRQVTSELKDCLALELTQRDNRNVTDVTNSSKEMISRATISQMSPEAR